MKLLPATRAALLWTIRRAWRRSGGARSVVLAALGAWAADELARRAAPVVAAGPARAAPLAAGAWLALLAYAAAAERARPPDLLWRSLPLSGPALVGARLLERALDLLVPAVLLGAALRRWCGPLDACLPLLAVPALAAVSLALASRPATALLVLGAGAALAAHLPPCPTAALAALALLASLALPVAITRYLGAGLRRREWAGPAERTAAGWSRRLSLPLAALPRPVRALVRADWALMMRGGYPQALAIPVLLALPVAYLAWPLPRAPQAPLLIAGMLSAFGLSALGYLLGADLELAGRPYLALRRTAPISPAAAWWARQVLAVAAGLAFATVLCGAMVIRHGAEAAPFLLPVLALGALVPAYAAALGLAAPDGGDAAAAGAVASSAAVFAVVTLVAWLAFPPLVLALPWVLRGPQRMALARWRRHDVLA